VPVSASVGREHVFLVRLLEEGDRDKVAAGASLPHSDPGSI
jgi:hypothetical protein